MLKQQSRRETAAIAALTLGFLAWSAQFIFRSSLVAFDGHRYFCLFDDAMISMRYAWNLSHGLGLVWNAGERVEGYTNLLTTLLMSIPTLVFSKSNAVLTMQILGVVFMLAIGYLSVRLVDFLLPDEAADFRGFARVFAFVAALAYYPLLYWTLMGMETGLLTLLLLASILLAFKYARSGQPRLLKLMAICLGPAWLTRNDSLIFAILIAAYVIWDAPHPLTDRRFMQTALVAAMLYALFPLGQSLFRHFYYGEWLPNTYLLKLTGLPLVTRWKHGVHFVTPFLRQNALPLVLAALGTLISFRRRELLLLSLLVAAVAYEVYAGGDPWPYWRIMAPCMPLIFLLIVATVCGMVSGQAALSAGRAGSSSIGARLARTTAARLFAASILIGTLLWSNARFLREFSFDTGAYQVRQNESYVNVALALEQVTTGRATVGVVWAGSIPYYSGLWAIDFLGKSDRYIARLPSDGKGAPGHDKYDLRYSIKTLHPTFVQRLYYADDDLTRWGATRYVTAAFGGVPLTLLRDSPEVLWDRLTVLTP